MCEAATYVKLGTTALVLAVIEEDALGEDLSLVDPVREMHLVSHDPSLSHHVTLRDGRRMSAIDLQRRYLAACERLVGRSYGDDPLTRDILDRWSCLLDDLGEDPRLAADRIDWVAKHALMEGYRRRDGLDWSSPRLELIDLQYADIRPDRGLALRLEAAGRLQRITTDDEVRRAREYAPEDTRAYFRGECLRRYGDAVAAASWDSVIFDVDGQDALQRIPTLEPSRGTREHVGHLLEAAVTAEDLLEALRHA